MTQDRWGPPRQLVDPSLPEFFALEVADEEGRWWTHGVYGRNTFVPLDDQPGGLAHQGIGSPVFIRCVGRTGDLLHCINGAGNPFDYRLVVLPHPDYAGLKLDDVGRYY